MLLRQSKQKQMPTETMEEPVEMQEKGMRSKDGRKWGKGKISRKHSLKEN